MVSTNKASKAKAKASKADAEMQPVPELSSEAACVEKNGDRCFDAENAERGFDAFNERFEKEFGSSPFVSVRLEMLSHTVAALDEPYLLNREVRTPWPARDLVELDKEEGSKVLVQLIKGDESGELLDSADEDLLDNPTLYEVYAACHRLCGRFCEEAIGELPQDPRSLIHIHDETTPGDDEDADVRAVFTLGPAEI